MPGILHFASFEWASIEVRYKTEQERHASIKLQMTNVIRLGQSTSPFSHQSQVMRESDLVQLVAGPQLCPSALGYSGLRISLIGQCGVVRAIAL